MNRFQTSFSLRATVATVLLLGSAWSARGIVVDQFDTASSPAPWFFSNGPEYPGAYGSLSHGSGFSGGGAHLAFDTSAGGNYVAAIDPLVSPVTGGALRLWLKSPGGVRIQFRVNDSSGQTLQYSPNRPFDASDATQWYQMTVTLGPTADHWGGINDGTLHGSVTSISVMAQPTTTTVGAIDFDNVEIIPAPSTLVTPATVPATAAAIPNFSYSLGVEIAHADATTTGLNLVQSLGFPRVRTEMFWADVETTAGVYDFSWYDQLFAALKTRGLSAHFILCYGNPLYTGTNWFSPPLTPSAIAAFGNFAQAAAAHYAGQGVRFEVWNEPNIETFWDAPSSAAYSALSHQTIARINLGDPTAHVTTGGLAGIDLAFLDGMLANGGATGANGIGIHPYRLENPERLSADLPDARTHIKRGVSGSKPPVWSTEAGYSSAWYGDGSLPANRTTQAKFCVRQMLTGVSLGLVTQTVFSLRDAGTDVWNTEHNFGIVDANYQPKPLTAAVKTLLAQCQGWSYAGVLPSPQANLHILKFQKGTSTMLVLWSEDASGTVYPITFPTLPAQTVDYLGNAVTPTPAGKLGYSVNVTDSPVYVTFPAAAVTAGKSMVSGR